MEDFEEYKRYFQVVFSKDLGFSQKFSQQVDQIISKNIGYIIDHERHETEQDTIADKMGYDRTLKIPPIRFGARIRRIYYQHFWEFTVDEQEWNKETYPQVYLFGYGELDDNGKAKPLASYILFDYRKFRKLAKDGIIKHSTQQNREHSLVKFLCFSIDDIFKHKLAIDWGGTNPTYFKNNQRQKHF